MNEIPPLHTTVGRTVHDEHFFRGYASLREIMGVHAFWSQVSLALDGPLLDEDQCRIVDAMSASLLVPDPRLWLFKVGRLVASYGNAIAGIGADQLIMSDANIGSAEVEPTVEFQIDVAERMGENYEDTERMDELVSELLAEGVFFHGFGVPGRRQDERAAMIEPWYEECGRPESPQWKLYLNLKRAIFEAKGLRPHIGGTHAPMWLEMGFNAKQAMLMANTCILINATCNAYDGAIQSLPTYRRLPDAGLEYVGHESRQSPRASENDKNI